MVELTWDTEADWNDSTTTNVQIDGGSFQLASAIPEGGIARYTFEREDDTSIAVDSWNENNVSINGPVYTTNSQVGSHALSFDGVDDGAVLSSGFPDIGNEFTQMAWVYPASSSQSSYAIVSLNGNQGGSRVYKTMIQDDGSGNLRANIGDGSTSAKAGSLSYAADTWYHVAVTYDGSTLRFYVNGSLSASTTVSMTTYTTDELYLGYGVDDQGNESAYWNGDIDDSRYYSRALSESEINDIHTTTNTSG